MSEGARILFERLAVDAEGARYAVVIGEGEGACRAEARLGKGLLEVGGFDAPPAAWALESAKGLLRTLAKNHAESADWPRRVHRWRAPRG